MRKTKKGGVTLDDVALMVGRGFNATDKKLGLLDKKIELTRQEMNQRFYQMNQKLDKLERIILEDYGNRIEILEVKMRDLESDFRQAVGFKRR